MFLQECTLYTTTCPFCTTSCVSALACSNSSPDTILKTGFVPWWDKFLNAMWFDSFHCCNLSFLFWKKKKKNGTANFKASCCLYFATSHRKGSGMSLISVIQSTEPYSNESDLCTDTIFLQVSIIDEQIEDNLFHMLDEETDSEYVKITLLFALT